MASPRSLGSLGLCWLLAGCGQLPYLTQVPEPAARGAQAERSTDAFVQLFQRVDRNGDGRLSALESGLDQVQTAALDANHDGSLDRAEWEARTSWSTLVRKLPAFRPLIQSAFEQLDTDRSQRLSRQELMATIQAPGLLAVPSPQVVATTWKAADRNGDDQVSPDEFDHLYLQLGDSDAAGRGLLSGMARSLLGVYVSVTSRIAAAKALHPKRHVASETPQKLGMAYEDVTFANPEGLKFKGWFIPAAKPTTRAMILMHGHANNRAAFLNDQRAVLEAAHPDFNVLAFDLRAHGQSDGQAVTFGYYEGQDALSAIAYLKGRGCTDMAVYGTSLGGATAIRAAALSPEVRGVVDDCAYATVQAAFTGFIGGYGVPLPALVGAATLVRANRELGIDMSSTEPVSQVPRIAPRPFLVIHGADDSKVSPDNSRLNYEAAGTGLAKELWIVPGAGHNKSPVVAPEAYQEHLRVFLSRAFK